MAYLIPGWLLILEGGNIDGAVTRFGSPLGVVARQGFGLVKTTVHGTKLYTKLSNICQP